MAPTDPQTRRRVLWLSGFVLGGTSLVGYFSSADKGSMGNLTTKNSSTSENSATTTNKPVNPRKLSLRKLGQTQLSAQSSPSGGYSETDVRSDGRYAVVGTKWGVSGSYLVDLADLTSLKQVHYLRNADDAPTIDVKFDHRNGLYYRAIEETWPGNFEIVDYGYSTGTPKNPTVISTVSEGKSHNVTPHPTKPVLYTMNYELETSGFDVYDVTDPRAPRKLSEYGPQGAGHDITVDPEREVLCCAYQAGQFIGLVIYDISKPRNPVEIGRFNYRERKSYSQTEVGKEAFGSAHHGHFDPRRDLLIIGDERPIGIPGGKHIFDVGWKDGSLKNPIPIGFTVSPNARRMGDSYAERFDWTGHHFDIVPWGDATLLVSADWHEGVVLYHITDPTNPQPIDQYSTDDGMKKITPNNKVAGLGNPPMAWKADYNADREFMVASDSFTGLYTFELTHR